MRFSMIFVFRTVITVLTVASALDKLLHRYHLLIVFHPGARP